MKILVIGGGGREHALAWHLAKSPRVHKVFVAPGNGGTALASPLQNVPISDNDALIKFARDESVAFTVVGPEAPLAGGIVDAFRAAGLKIFGPTQAEAQLESSKDYAKAFMVRHTIPTARYQTFTDPAQAKAYITSQGAPIVVKADGLAAGKGVVVATSVDEAHSAIDAMLGDGSLGDAGARVVIEECLLGEEASFIVMCDGNHVLPLATSQDHKRLLDGDLGPNTGGMGAYSPAPVITPALHNRIMREVIHPTMAGMAKDGLPYSGFLYAGLMIGDGPDATRTIKVLEYNCRMGDPETQPIMMRIKSDLTQVFEQAIAGKLDEANIDWDRRCAMGVVMAAANYPATPRLDDVIEHLPENTDELMVFHAGTRLDGDILKTSGGRVLCVTVLADSIKRAQAAAYAAASQVRFEGKQYRSDIGWRALPSPSE
ncbi:phosphoribosylamine--glycine ligase [Pusillimonas sp. ANT_WB101]|uniref:phosphoribosylamine--glycine ligase n=1 Tax=Pusillimonas sp. ANT_WB101 TaxID=2597356 RepID=UPI0011EFCDA7|nr:phosphoribosylamine--glycine ligase [Pusillimonas sp. ANT_WB101]KAA0911886.1 phosphoribosylamine--glycine ligase [Pusillimonas sp. ANT_WB101]